MNGTGEIITEAMHRLIRVCHSVRIQSSRVSKFASSPWFAADVLKCRHMSLVDKDSNQHSSSAVDELITYLLRVCRYCKIAKVVPKSLSRRTYQSSAIIMWLIC